MIRLLRRVRNYLLLLLALAVLAAGYLTLTPPGRANLASIASSLASGEGRTVRIDGLAGLWTGPLTVKNVVVEDAKGPWLALRDISTDISLFSAAFGTVKADTLRIGRVEVARRPDMPPSEEPSTGFQLPVDIDIAALDLPDIALGEELAGGMATLSAKGRAVATASPLRVDAALDARRSDAPGELALTVLFAPDEDRLDVRVEGNEPAGGVVANMLRLPGAPPVSIAVEGNGPASNWQVQGAIAVDEQVAVKLSGTHRFVENGSRIDFTGEGAFAQFLPENLRPVAEGQTAIKFAGTISNDGAIDVEDATLASQTLEAKASGRIDPRAESDFSLHAQSIGQPVALSFGEGVDRVTVAVASVEASVRGSGARPAVSAAASLPSLTHAQGSALNVGIVLTSPGFDVASGAGPVELQVSAGSVASPNEALAPLLAGQAALSAKADIETGAVRLSDVALRNDALSATAAGTISRSDNAASLDVTAKVQRSALPAGAHGVLGDVVTVKAALSRAADGALSISGLDLASGPLALQGAAALKDGAVDADLTGALADLARLSPGVAGGVRFSLAADGPLLAPQVKLDLSGDRIESSGQTITGLKLSASGVANPADPAADVTLSGRVGDQDLTGAARLATSNGRRQVSKLNLSLGQNRISGDLDLDASFLPVGTVQFELPDIGPLAALALQQASGSAKGTIAFASGKNGPEVSLDATVPQFARDAVTARDIRIKAQVENYLAAPSVSGRVEAQSVMSGGTAVSDIGVTLTRDGVWTGFDGGATVNGIPATAKGRAKFENGVATVELDGGKATVQGVAAAIAGKSVIENANGITTVQRLTVGVGGGTATVSGTAGKDLALGVELAGIPASVANNFAPGLGAAGAVSGTVRVTGTPAAPNVAYDVRLAGAETSQSRAAGFGQMNITSNGTFAGGTLRFDATVGEGGGLAMRGGGTVQTTGGRPLNVNLSGKVPFGFLARRLAAQGLALTGAADVQLSVSGSAAAPVIGGRVQSSGARFIDAGSGIAVNDIAMTIDLGGGVARISSLTGAISSGGTISAGGTVGLDGGQGFPADLSIKVADGRYTDGRVVTANFGGDLAVKGPLVSTPTISGTVNLGRTVITLPEKLPASLSRLNVKHKNASGEVARQAEALQPASAKGGGGSGLALDLNVSAPQQIFVRGRGLNAELGGTIRLVGPASSPVANGLFEMRRGRLGILGRRLDFSEGSIGFAGSFVPQLDFAAISTISSGSVTVTVTGEANNPKFTFTSVPAMPEDEVFAQLVFGRAMGSLSAVQIAQLAQAAALLAGVGGSTGLLDKLQSGLGVDDLDVKTDEKTGDTSVSAGKYLNDRTYVTIEKGSRPGSGKAAIDLNVGKGVKLRGEAADDGSTKGGIFYEKEY